MNTDTGTYLNDGVMVKGGIGYDVSERDSRRAAVTNIQYRDEVTYSQRSP